MLYLDYSRKDGEWVPNQYGGREHLEAVQLLQETNATVYKRVPGVVTIAEESTSWPGVTRPTHLGGLGLRAEVEHGLDARLAGLHGQRAGPPAVPPPPDDVLADVRLERELRPADQPRRGRPRQGLAAAQDARATGGSSWPTLRAYLALMWAHPGKQLLFMGTEFAQEAEWADGRSLDWWLLDQPAHYGVHQLVKDLNRVYRETPALWALRPDARAASVDRRQRRGGQHVLLPAVRRAGRGRRRAGGRQHVNFSGGPHIGYRLGLPQAGRWNEILNTDAEGYGGSGVGNLGSVMAEEVPWHGQPGSAPGEPARRSARSGLEPAERVVPASRSRRRRSCAAPRPSRHRRSAAGRHRTVAMSAAGAAPGSGGRRSERPDRRAGRRSSGQRLTCAPSDGTRSRAGERPLTVGRVGRAAGSEAGASAERLPTAGPTRVATSGDQAPPHAAPPKAARPRRSEP